MTPEGMLRVAWAELFFFRENRGRRARRFDEQDDQAAVGCRRDAVTGLGRDMDQASSYLPLDSLRAEFHNRQGGFAGIGW
ncbi:MAG: hypothetical protein A3H28_05865 [Acidobacteria bacterium RIFCSPLOWO2_02_FULL_61_28]|nr:MAG: hypothetical protein A3H28_05865 [Acidobacteria bacterium RIFCSPLOWO2_02_FULL_61_28]